MYGGQRAPSGPTLASCRVEQDGGHGGRRLVLRFDAGALRGEQLVLQGYQPGRSLLQVLLSSQPFSRPYHPSSPFLPTPPNFIRFTSIG